MSITRWTPGCDCGCFYTVRRYRPDGTTAWHRLYGSPLEPDATPVDCAVGSDGRVFVIGPRIGAGDDAYSLRCYAANGDILWQQDVAAAVPGIPANDFARDAVLLTEIERDAADNVYVSGWYASGGLGFVASFATDGTFLSVTDTTAIAIRRLGVAADGTVRFYTDDDLGDSPGEQILRDLSISLASGGDLWRAAAGTNTANGGGGFPDPGLRPLQIANLTAATGVTRHMYVSPIGPYGASTFPEDARRVCLDESQRATFAGTYFWPDEPFGEGPFPPDPPNPNTLPTIARFDDGLDLLWATAAAPVAAAGPIACNYAGDEIVALLVGGLDGGSGDYVASLCKLDADGDLIWCHLHANGSEVDLGEDGTVAVVRGQSRIGKRDVSGNPELSFLAALQTPA